jgi:predicted DNA-binding transcriptional regulator YafY
VQELAKYFNTSDRTIQRDLNDLRESNTGIEEQGNHYWIPQSHSPINSVEALAMYSAARLLFHHTTIRERHYSNALEKLAQYIPEPARETLLKSIAAIDAYSSTGSRALEQVARAWFERRVLRYYYQGLKDSEPRPRELEVYFLELNPYNLASYAIGRDRHKDEVRMFKLDRMERTILLKDGYIIPESFDPQALLKPAWGVIVGEAIMVRLRVRADASYRIREGGYRNLHIEEELSDGGLLIRIKTAKDKQGLPLELIHWILGWGPKIEVLEPEGVRVYLKGELSAALAHYG